jgi:hypothetical protein
VITTWGRQNGLYAFLCEVGLPWWDGRSTRRQACGEGGPPTPEGHEETGGDEKAATDRLMTPPVLRNDSLSEACRRNSPPKPPRTRVSSLRAPRTRPEIADTLDVPTSKGGVPNV